MGLFLLGSYVLGNARDLGLRVWAGSGRSMVWGLGWLKAEDSGLCRITGLRLSGVLILEFGLLARNPIP